MKSKLKVGIISLGCPRNIVDSESILSRLNLLGHKIVDIEKADIAIVNTCAFIEDAKVESIDAILDLAELKKHGRLKKIIVYGCLVQRYKEELLNNLPEVDAFVGRVSPDNSGSGSYIVPKHYAYLKICEGCVNNCSYCIIPKIKGKFYSINENSLIKSVKDLDRRGISELNIIGQDITGYGLDLCGRQQLPVLLKKILKSSRHINWFRLLYLNPLRVSDELLNIIAGDERICKYIDIPLQHINDRILKLMNRGISKHQIIRLIEKIRKIIPGVALRTAFIVGFPSETDKEFNELVKFIEDVKFERLGAFVYSREEGTAAYDFKGQIPLKVKKERFDVVMSRQQDVSRIINNRFLGRTIDVIIDEQAQGHYSGRSQFDAPEVDGTVFVRSKRKLRIGEIVRVRINDTMEYDLAGETTI